MSIGVIRRSAAHRRRLGEVAADTWWDGNGTISGCAAAFSAYTDNKAASFLDLSGNAADATEFGTVPWSNGQWGGFSGSNYFRFSVAFDSDWTWLMRLVTSSTGVDVFLQTGEGGTGNISGGYTFDKTLAVFFHGDDASNAGSFSLTADTSVVLGQAANKAYKDGIFQTNLTGTWSGGANSFVQVGVNTAFTVPFGGTIAAISAYNRTLDAGEIATISTAMTALS